MGEHKHRRDQAYGPNGELLEEIEWNGDDLTVTYRRYALDGSLIEERPATDADWIGPPPGFFDGR